MKRAIIGFHRDEVGDWVADLACGHTQHVRHNPPLVSRPWVLHEEGRRQFIGQTLDCPECDRSAPKQLVAAGYDAVADEHAEWAQRTRRAERRKYTNIVLESLPAGADVLELGCGAGLPTTRRLTERFTVTGVDISQRNVELARTNAPSATIRQADMTELSFPPASFDAVTAFYSLIHVPREEQPALLHTIASWLRPDGLLVATLGASDVEAGYSEDWLGAPMYWSTFDSRTSRQMVEDAGLEIISAREETEQEFGDPVTFLWIIARA